jgi:hypothetical protein
MYGIIRVIDWFDKILDGRNVSNPLTIIDVLGSSEGTGGYITTKKR